MIVGYRGYGHFHINNSNCGQQKTVYKLRLLIHLLMVCNRLVHDWQSRGRVIVIVMTLSQLLVVVQRRHFSTCTNNNNVIHLPSAGISPSVSSPSGKTVKEETSCFFGSRIFKEEKTTHLAIMHYP